MPLTVLSVAYPFSPVSPATAGGAEQILATLDSGLTARGHRSLVVACEGSTVSGKLYPVAANLDGGVVTPQARACARVHTRSAIDRALSEHPVDLVHMHGLDAAEYQIPHHIPLLFTLHVPFSWHGESLLRYRHPKLHFSCVSHTQRSTLPPTFGNATVIENGVALEPLNPRPKENFALVLGRICPEKNAHAALLAGSIAGVDVILAGQVFPYPEHVAYFETQVKPLLGPQPSGVSHRFIGQIGPEARRDLLTRARCLLHPTLAPETSSLVAMEALAAGTPVIAFRSGALPEIISHAETGFLVNSAEEMAAAIPCTARLSPERCHREAETRFSRDRMLDQYLALYQRIVSRQPVSAYA